MQYDENLLNKLLFHVLPWKRKLLLCDLSLLNKPIPPISMHCNSQVAISKVTSKNFTGGP